MQDDFEGQALGLNAPAVAAEAIIPNDTADLAYATRAIFVGQSGDIAIRTLSGDDVTLINVQAGSVLPIRAAQVRATGTTAAALVGLR
jgi:hypothetical protein